MKKKFLLTLLLSFMLVFTLTACGKVDVNKIEVSNQKTEFAYGDEFSLGDDFEIKAVFSDGVTRVLLTSEYEVDSSAYNKLVAGTYEIVISYKQDTTKQVSYNVVVKDKVMSSIAVSTTDAPKATYIQGQTLDLSVGKLIVSYEVGESDIINLNAEGVVVTGFDSTNAVNGQVLTVTYAGKSTTFTVNILAKVVTGITIKDAPKSSYFVGDDMDRASGSILVTYNDGGEEIIALSDSGVSINGFDTTTAKDDHEVTITYAGQTAIYTIDVVEPTLEEISLVAPTKNQYFIGQTIDLAGGKIVATYNNGSKDIVLTDARVSITGFNSSAEATNQVVTVTFGGLSKTFTVNIIRKSATEISIATAVNKTEYYVGDNLDLTGATIDVNYNDSSFDTLALTHSDVSIVGFDSSTANDALTVTIKVDDATTTFTVKIYARSVNTISITSQPTKLIYFVGQDLDLSGLAVKAIYPLHEEEVDVDDVEVSGFDSSEAVEDQVVTVTYAGKTATFTVDIINKSVESISMETNPTTVNYYVGDELDIVGGEIRVDYNDESHDVITLTAGGVSVTGFDSLTAGEKEVTVTYEGKTTTFTVNVFAKEVKSIEILSNPTKLTYFVGQMLNINGLRVNAIYELHSEEIENSELSVTGFDSSEVNDELVVTVTYNGKTDTFTVSIIEKTATEIEIEEEPVLVYFVNDTIDLTKGSIKVNYNDDSHEIVALNAEGVVVTGFDSSEAVEELELTITYKELTTTYIVEVVEKIAMLIAVNDDVQRKYTLDSTLNLEKGTIKVYYENGLSENIAINSDGVVVTGFISNQYIDELELTVTYQELTTTYIVSIAELDVIGLSVNGIKTTYYQYEEFDCETGSATVTYEDGSTKNINLYELSLENFESHEAKEYVVYINYNGVRIEVEFTIIALVYNSLEVTNTKTNYYKGEMLNLSYIGLVCDTNAGEKEITSYDEDVVISGYNCNTLGTQTVTVTYKGVSDTFAVTVNNIDSSLIASISLNTYPYILTYSSKDTKWDLTGGSLYVQLNDDGGNSINIDMTCSNVLITNFDVSTIGTKELTVNYFGHTTTFEVEIVENLISNIAVYTKGADQYNEYVLENDGTNEFEIELDGEMIESLYINCDAYYGHWQVDKVLNKNGTFTITGKYVNYYTKKVHETFIIDVTMSNVGLELFQSELSVNNGTIVYDEENDEYIYETFLINSSFIGPDVYLYNGVEYDGNEIQEVEFEIGTHEIDLYFFVSYESYYVVKLNLIRYTKIVESIKFNGVTYETDANKSTEQEHFLFEVARGSKHIAQIIYDDENYIALVSGEEYTSATDYELQMVYYNSDAYCMDVEIYDRAKYEAYLIAMEQYENGEIFEYPYINYIQELWVEVREEDFIKSLNVIGEEGADVHHFFNYRNNGEIVLDEDFNITVGGFVEDIEIEMEEGYTYKLLTNGKEDGVYYFDKNEMQVLVYNENEELVRVVPFILDVQPVGNAFNIYVDGEYLDCYDYEITYVTTFDEASPRLYYEFSTWNWISNNDIKLNAHFEGIDKVSRTGKKLNGWYNYDLGYQEIYLSMESKLGNRIYFKFNIFVAKEDFDGNQIFSCLRYSDVENTYMGVNFSQYMYIYDEYEIHLPVGTTAQNLTLLDDMEQEIDADISFIENGKVLKIEAEIAGVTHIAYYLVKQNYSSDIADFKLVVVDIANMEETVYTPDVTSIESCVSSVIIVETFDGYANVEIESNNYLMFMSTNMWMITKEGEFTVTVTVTPSSGDISKAITLDIVFNVTLAEMFSVNLGDKELKSYLGHQTLHESSDFSIITAEVMGSNPTYVVAADVSEDDVVMTQEGGVRYVTMDIEHAGMEKDIRVWVDGQKLTSLEDVKLKVKTSSKGYDYVEFDTEFSEANIKVIIIIAELTNGLTIELTLGDDTHTFTAYEIEAGFFYGDFMAVNVYGVVMAEAILINPDFANQEVPPTTVTGKVSNLGDYALAFGTMDMGNGEPEFDNVVTPLNQNNLTLELTQLVPGVYAVMGALMEIDLETQMPINQTVLVITISASGISMFTMMAGAM